MNITILGAGAWGTALAIHFAARHRVTLWVWDPKQLAAMAASRINEPYLPGLTLPAAVLLEGEVARALEAAELALVVVPTSALRETFRRIVRDGDVGSELVDEAIAIATGGADSAHVTSGELIEDAMPVSYQLRYSREATCGALAALAAWADALVTELNANPQPPN